MDTHPLSALESIDLRLSEGDYYCHAHDIEVYICSAMVAVKCNNSAEAKLWVLNWKLGEIVLDVTGPDRYEYSDDNLLQFVDETPDDFPGTVAFLDMNHIIMPIISGVCNPRTKKPYTMGIGVLTLGKEERTGPPQGLADYMRPADVVLMLPEPPEQTSMATYDITVSCDPAPPVTGHENAPFVRTSRSSLVRILTNSYRRNDSLLSFVVHTNTVLSFLESKQHGTAAVPRSRCPSVVPWERWAQKARAMEFAGHCQVSSTRYLRDFAPAVARRNEQVTVCDFDTPGTIARQHGLLPSEDDGKHHYAYHDRTSLRVTPSTFSDDRSWKEGTLTTALPYRERGLPDWNPGDAGFLGDGYVIILRDFFPYEGRMLSGAELYTM